MSLPVFFVYIHAHLYLGIHAYSHIDDSLNIISREVSTLFNVFDRIEPKKSESSILDYVVNVKCIKIQNYLKNIIIFLLYKNLKEFINLFSVPILFTNF